jgi:hypothetical protein
MIEFLARLLVEFQLANADVAPPGWAVRVLARCGIAYMEIWDVFHKMYESQVRRSPETRKTGFSKILSPLARFLHSPYSQPFRHSQLRSVSFSRIGWKSRDILLASISQQIVLTRLWSSISESWRLAMHRKQHVRVTSASVGSFGDFGSFML